jgi:dipeptidyl aminopeptidase/acylaminoacyl peptidase
MSARTGKPIRQLWPGAARSIDWSPDGRRIVFTATRDERSRRADVYVVRADGTGLRRLTSTRHTSEEDVVWSPDGLRLALVREIRRPDGECCESIAQSIWTMRPDGTAQRRLRRPWRGHDEDGKGPVQISWQPLPPRR